jgi:ureidoacrylate peracid hydrolase
MNANETAILLIEFQHEFCSPGGKNYDYVKDVLDKNQTIPNTVDLVAKARAKGVHLLYIPICFECDYREMSAEPYGVAKLVKDAGAFQKGTKNAEIIPELKPGPSDIVIEGKRAPDGFASTNLDFTLRQLGIKNVAVAGFLTNVCVESTVRTAYEKGFQVVSLIDCTACGSMEIQEFTVKNNFPTFSFPMTHDDFLAQVN